MPQEPGDDGEANGNHGSLSQQPPAEGDPISVCDDYERCDNHDINIGRSESQGEDSDEIEDDLDEDEPRLKYQRLTGNLGPVYRNGDSTSCFLVSGDKMVRVR